MRFELLPPAQAGPIVLGMSLQEAQENFRQLPGYVDPDPLTPPQPTHAHYDNGLSIGVDLRDGRVIAVELYRPDDTVLVVYDEIAVFQETADQVITLMGGRTRLDIVEDGGHVVAPDLLLSFWRAALPEAGSEDGLYFDSVLVSAPGYYDSPGGRASYLD